MCSNSNSDSFTRVGAEVLENVAATLVQIAKELGSEFSEAAQAISEIPSEGRLLISGMGKTGFIGMKISASFASIGVPSFFIHPAEAAHGDLGRIKPEDLIMFLSNSGETPEILRLLPAIKRIGASSIAITGTERSKLAQRVDIPLCLGKIQEAGPLGLAPTSSTTAMLAVGDALTMAVANCKKTTREEFALYHPGGTLGRTLMLVSEVMRSGDEHCIILQDVIGRDVIHRISITPNRPGAASIVDANGNLVGIFTDGDLRRCLDKRIEFLDAPISAVMGTNPKTVMPDALAESALKIMSEYKIDQVVVIDHKNQPIGMVDIQDLVQSY